MKESGKLSSTKLVVPLVRYWCIAVTCWHACQPLNSANQIHT